MENQNIIHGLEINTYNRLASNHSQANIFLWIIGGLFYNLIHGDLISLTSVLVLLPGIFIVSFASIPTFFIKIKRNQILQKTDNPFIVIGFLIWSIFDLIYPIVLSILFINIINYLF